LSDANKLLIRCAWAGTAAFNSGARTGSGWWPSTGSCPAPPPSPPPPSSSSPSPLPPSPSLACIGDTFTTKDSLKTALKEFNSNAASAIAKYGPIADWCVSAITDMRELFFNLGEDTAPRAAPVAMQPGTRFSPSHLAYTRTFPPGVCMRWPPASGSPAPHTATR